MNRPAPLVELKDVWKSYRKGAEIINAVAGIDLDLAERGMVAIVGPSGSGKSTLLHLMGAMDRPTRGAVRVAGHNVGEIPQRALTRFRREVVGFVFQTFNLIPNLTAVENVALPMEFNGVARAARLQRVQALLDRVELGQRARHRPNELSGGEMQRVAIARALANEPRVVLADEPTGNLDSATGRVIYELLRGIARERTVVVVTHSEELARLADRILHLRDGRLANGAKAQAGVTGDGSHG
jgi:ABC-type lipoprotein export system ATPase subunit